jgi:membrane associated rhomboid family serine protease
MLIIGDEGHYHGRFPWVTASLVVINVVVYVAQVFLGEPFTHGFALVPEEIVTFQDLQGTKYHKVKIEVDGRIDAKGEYHPRFETKHFPIKHYPGPFPIFLTLFTSMFLHGDLFHLIGNMWFLLVFGRNVECAMNHGRFLAFYTACGLAAGLAHVASDPHSILPCLGASGAISGVLGAYVSIHPLNTIRVWFGFWIGVIELPALVVIGVWFLLNYLSAFISFNDDAHNDGVAYWAHLGGFVAGFIIIRAVVFYLNWQKANGKLQEEEPLAPVAKDEIAGALPPPVQAEKVPSTFEPTAVQAGDPDPFAKFLSVQTVRKIQAQKRQEKADSH